ncbi:MAG: bifunctional 23S rRNA (guanine(2069)-N(7))-methyltransferase RlmK/23S rRNA (guanine(2445)-N(2))-methyltransferase RlmL [Magnetococcales bacterium]|nr:bifunctional 23S rRNA (guanine(2069)-N(7))-methyltransferase RlmK/23S rRNA (guanine(2445)-N(2))-methyltransferase RlmL [Magnetococcales bacterium]
MSEQSFFATVPRGLETVLKGELRRLGAATGRPFAGGVPFQGDVALALRVILHSRIASRVILPLARIPAGDADALYAGVAALPWEDHLAPGGSLTVDFHGTNSAIRHTRFGAQRVKDGVVDRLRGRRGVRPAVDHETPHLRIQVRLQEAEARVGLDLSGGPLHRRGYRPDGGGVAPLKENLAAALLVLCGWPERAGAGQPFLDPLCGSGTLVLEAFSQAADVAPGLARRLNGFAHWPGTPAGVWEELLEEARDRARIGMARAAPVFGWDQDAAMIRQARDSAGLLGFPLEKVRFEVRKLGEGTWPGSAGLLLANPPYGHRMGEADAPPGPSPALEVLYVHLGELLGQGVGANWAAGIFTAHPLAEGTLGWTPREVIPLDNGPLECRLLRYAGGERLPLGVAAPGATQGAAALANRIRKNLKQLQKWTRREAIHCYRVYDADIPEYALAVDYYDGWLHVQEYAPPARVDEDKARTRLAEARALLPQLLGVVPERVFFKTRQRQRGREQYQSLGQSGQRVTVREGGLRFLVNFTDHLDTGLFLDHRRTRALIRERAAGRRFLNLFGYTGSATVYAAAGGARATVTVDISAPYLDWARANLAANGLEGPRQRLVRADVSAWLAAERDRYGLIFLDPPTFSNSKRLETAFDLQRDHLGLIRQAAGLLEPDGELIFSCNARRFVLDETGLEGAGLAVEEITARTRPPDFTRRPPHRCWRLSRRAGRAAGG